MKKTISFLLTLLLAFFISGATGANPYIVAPALLILGAIAAPSSISNGVFYDVSASSGFAGTNIATILSLLVLGAETIQKGLLHTIPNKYDIIYMPTLNTAPNQLQDRVATPTTSADSEYDERVIDPQDIMWYQEFNPATFEHVWQDFWPKGAMVNQIQDPKIQGAVTSTIRGSINTQLDAIIWQGDDTLGALDPLRFFDGFLKTMSADVDVVKVVIAGPIDAANIQEILDDMITAMPPAVRVRKRPKFIMSHETFDAFEQYTTSLDFKGNSVYDGTQLRYRGYLIVPVGGMTETDIVFCDATPGPEGNLFAGTWLANDKDNFLISRLQANSELWFIKALFRYGVQYGKSEEIVLANYTAP